MRARRSDSILAKSSGPGSIGIIALASSAVGVQAPQRLVDVDLSSSYLLHQLDPRGRGSGGPLPAQLGEKPLQTRSRGRIALTQLPLPRPPLFPPCPAHSK